MTASGSVSTSRDGKRVVRATGRVACDAPVIVPCGLAGGPTDDLTSFRAFGLHHRGEDLPPLGAFVEVTAERDRAGLCVLSWRAVPREHPGGGDPATVRKAMVEVRGVIRALEESPGGDRPLVLVTGLRLNHETGRYCEELVLRHAPRLLSEALARVDPELLWFSVFERTLGPQPPFEPPACDPLVGRRTLEP